MPLTDHLVLHKLFRRHAHDVRNYCSGIDIDAILLADLSEDPETTAIASRLRKQVARIEAELKLLLLKLEDPRPVTLTLGDLLQLWRMKLQSLTKGSADVDWPEELDGLGGVSLTLDSRLVVQVLCNFCAWTWDRQPAATLQVKIRKEMNRMIIDLIHPVGAHSPAEYVEENATVLAAGGLELSAAREPGAPLWIISLAIPTAPPLAG